MIATGYEYWLNKRDRSGQSLPGRQHFDPIEMKEFLPHVVLTDVVRDHEHYRFRHRLIGTHIAEFLGREVTGRYIEHMGWLDIFDELYRRFAAAVDEQALIYGVSAAPGEKRGFMAYEHLTLPLASDGDTVDMLFGIRCALPYADVSMAREYVVAPLVEHADLHHL